MSLDRSLRARIQSSVRARAHALVSVCVHMHLDSREFACVHTYKCKCSFLRACSRAGLIKKQNAFVRKKTAKLKRTLGSETFRMYYSYPHSQAPPALCIIMILIMQIYY